MFVVASDLNPAFHDRLKPMTAVHTQDDPNPYLAARREWDERYGGQIAQIRHWRWAAFLALTAAAVSSAGLVAMLSERRIVPYVVKVDKLGSALAVDRAEEAAQRHWRVCAIWPP